ncbi:hypothetical protein [Nostoc foliaceum]|uniref:Uncharacterized protein n=1 Tax=Nostoc linckia FACHB-391 TaxID=2692906 RepID=A0ABR8F5Y2_NOSLI|nr:hypothetical protein [Nostoc foliaceum]MBD2565041.1 hypothetical protein [Nostoc linckia FACHB-391]
MYTNLPLSSDDGLLLQRFSFGCNTCFGSTSVRLYELYAIELQTVIDFEERLKWSASVKIPCG